MKFIGIFANIWNLEIVKELLSSWKELLEQVPFSFFSLPLFQNFVSFVEENNG